MAARSNPLIALGLVIASCTLTKTTVDDCTTNADCRTAFGPGSICGGAGLCEPAPANPRCTTTFPVDVLSRREAYPGVLLFGVLMDRSVESQRQRENAIRLAVKQVNEQQGLDGRPFAAVMCDVAENPQYDALKRTDAAVAGGRYLADVIGVPAIIGPSSSTDALAVYDALKSSDVLVVSPSATSPSITGIDTKTPTDAAPGLFWRTAPPDTFQGAAIVRFLTQQNPVPSNVAIINEKGAYGDSLAQVVRAGFETGGRTVNVTVFTNSGERDAQIQSAGSTGAPFVLFFSSQTADAVAFLNSANVLPSYASTRVFLTDSAANRDLLTGTMGASAIFPRVSGSRPQVPQGDAFELFRLSFQAEFKVDANTFSFVAHSYDAAWLVMYGTASSVRREGGRVTGTGIARGLRKVVATGPQVFVNPGNWKQIADAIAAGTAVNLAGTSGTLDYDPATEETASLVEIWGIADNGQSIVVDETIDPR